MKRKQRFPVFFMAVVILLSAVPADIHAGTIYLPGVTAAMSKPSYWAEKVAAPDAVLVSMDEIQAINKAIIAADGTGARSMLNWSRKSANTTFNGTARNAALKKSAEEDAEYTYSQGARYLDGKALSREEAMEQLYGPMIDNCADPKAKSSMPTLYAICTTRTNLRTFPSPQALPDDPDDPDFDLQYLAAVNVGEPLVLRGKSRDGNYYNALTSYCAGWVPAKDIALCGTRSEWEEAWNFKADETLVVYDDKILTEESNYSPATSKRKLHMGTCLQMADPDEWKGKIGNRYAYNNYVVWMPVRLDNGRFDRQLALISEHCRVSEGFLSLTTSNLLMVMFNQLGNAYGWGGMLGSQDCSGYVRDVYRCFGFELGRNTTQQKAQPVRKYNLEGKSDEEKTEIIKQLPPGALLLFSGHAMLYLGSEGDNLYVISSASNMVPDKVKQRVRGAVINTLAMKRANSNTWLTSLTTAEIPYYSASAKDFSGSVSAAAIEDQEYTGQALTPSPKVTLSTNSGKITLVQDVHYTVTYKNNTEVGKAGVIIKGKGNYKGKYETSFRIKEKSETEEESSPEDDLPQKETVVSLTLSEKTFAYNGKEQKPKVKVLFKGWELEEADYTVIYPEKSRDVGIYKVSVELKNGYSGKKEAGYKIVPAKTSITGIKRGSKSLTVKWKKQKKKMSQKRITGYQLQISPSKKFSYGCKKVTVKKYSKKSKKITKLKKNKRYYVRVRTYMTVDGKKYYSEWSKAKSAVTK